MSKKIDEKLKELFERTHLVDVVLVSVEEPKYLEVFKPKDEDFVITVKIIDGENYDLEILTFEEYQNETFKYDFACSVLINHRNNQHYDIVASTSETIENKFFGKSTLTIRIVDKAFLERFIEIADHSQSSIEAFLFNIHNSKELDEFIKNQAKDENRYLNFFSLENQVGDVRDGFLADDVNTWYEEIEA